MRFPRAACWWTIAALSTVFGCEARLNPAPPRPAAKGPLKVCAQNPRWLDDGTGHAVVLVGSHTWNNLQDDGDSDPPPAFDFDGYLQMLSDHSHNFFRLWRLEPAEYRYEGDRRHFTQPHPWRRTGPGIAANGKPKFDLSQFDEEYFHRLRSRVQAAGDRGIYVAVMLFEGHALGQAAEAWSGHPFNDTNNINGLGGDVNHDGRGVETQTLGDLAVIRVEEAYVRHVIETVNDLDNVLYEICNEAHADSKDWQEHMIDFVQTTERLMPKQHLVICSAMLDDDGTSLWNSSAQIISPGKKREGSRVPLIDDPPPIDAEKVVMLDTDHLWGCGGDPQWVFKAFLRGYHPIYMDPWTTSGGCGKPNEHLRRNLGAVLQYADRMDLAAMTPRGDLVSSNYCLANPGIEYLAYLPEGGSVQLDLRDAGNSSFSVEWFSPRRAETHTASVITGGEMTALTAPFSGDALLYLHAQR